MPRVRHVFFPVRSYHCHLSRHILNSKGRMADSHSTELPEKPAPSQRKKCRGHGAGRGFADQDRDPERMRMGAEAKGENGLFVGDRACPQACPKCARSGEL